MTFLFSKFFEKEFDKINFLSSPGRSKEQADECFYRGGFYNWFEGGPVSSLLPSETKGSNPEDGIECNGAGR